MFERKPLSLANQARWWLMLLLASFGAAHAECPEILTEAQPLGSPAHSAQVMVTVHESCPLVKKVSAILYSGDNQISSRSFYDDAINNPPIAYPVRDALTLPNVAGLYRLEWATEFTDGEIQRLSQTFSLSCPVPGEFDIRWNDADSTISFVAPGGDVCEGETTASLKLSDLTGEVAVEELTKTYRTDEGIEALVEMQLPKLAGERRYVGSISLVNDSQQTTVVPVEFVTGCGTLDAETNILGERMVGSVKASDCQFPITMKISVTHESGKLIRQFDALLNDRTFDFELPEYDSWPAGKISIATQFVGSATRTRTSNEVAIACEDPVFSDPSLELNESGNSADVVFALDGRNVCQNQTRVTLQVRDNDRVVVFNRTLDLEPGGSSESFRWPFFGIPGSTYNLEVGAHFGLDQETVVEEDTRAVYECTAPKVLHFGNANADATHVAGLVALTACNAPATAKLIVRNDTGRVVVDAEPQILQDVGTAYARVAPISLGHLRSSDYKATLVVADNRGRTATSDIDLFRDVDGPQIRFNVNGEDLEEGSLPTISSLDDLSLVFSDTNAPLDTFRPHEQTPEVLMGDAEVTISRIDGEATPQMWFTGVLDSDRATTDLGFVGVLVRGQNGSQWLAPITRSYVPNDRVALAGFHPARSRVGFRAVARIQPLEVGRYEVVGAVVTDSLGETNLIRGTGTFDISSLAGQQHDALLRQGVTEIPVALNWSGDHVAKLERITSVPDGDYTLSAIGRDIYGNASSVFTQVFRLDQEKQQASLSWPAIVGFKQSYQHKFRAEGVTSSAPLRVLYRRVSGFGDIRINGRNVSEQTTEDVLRPGPDGVFSVSVELMESDVDARFVLHADSTDAAPLELSIKTFKPEYVTQRTRDESTDTLSIKYIDQPCRHIVFDDLSKVSLRSSEVLCAVRLNVPGTSVLSTNTERTDIRLPQGVATEALYEEGFVRAVQGQPTFQATRKVPIKDIQTYSATPQLSFAPVNAWRSRAKDGRYVTAVGDTVPGHFVIRAGLGQPNVFVNGEQVDLGNSRGSSIRIPVRTSVVGLGKTETIQVRAFYPETPDVATVQTYEFVSVPGALFMEAKSGSFVAPGELGMSLSLNDGDGGYNVATHGRFELTDVSVISRDDPSKILPKPTVTIDDSGNVETVFGSLSPGAYRLQIEMTSVDPRYTDHLAPLKTDTTFDIHDGSPVKANVFTFRSTDKIPFFGQLSVDYAEDARRKDVSKVAWEVSDDGISFEELQCCGQSFDFALTEPGNKHYRAVLTNRHSDVVSRTDGLQVNAFISGRIEVVGPRQTFRGYPASFSVKNLPEDYDVLWRVTSPNTNVPIEYRSSTIEVSADETGVYHIEVVADTATDDPDSVSAIRKFFTLECNWPRIPESVIAGPTQVEYGKSATFTVTHPPIFSSRGNETIKRVGEWELPDGSRVQDDEWTEFTLREMPEGFSAVNILYHTWIEGDKPTTTTAVHRIEPITYRWPNWRLKVATNSIEPPSVVRLSVSPENWQDWMGLGASPINTHWEVPDHVQFIDRTPTEAIVYAVDNREFDVRATITDPRGNVTELAEANVRPIKRVPFEISLSAKAERSLLTAPIQFTAHVDPIILPKDSRISRVAFYINGLYSGVTDGAPIDLQIRTPGVHTLRAVASAGDTSFTADDTIELQIGENHRAKCEIVAVGDFRLNGLAKAQCDDPDGHMVEYRWYSNGQLLSDSSTRVQLSKSDRLGINELSLVAVDNAGIETTARYVPAPSNR